MLGPNNPDDSIGKVFQRGVWGVDDADFAGAEHVGRFHSYLQWSGGRALRRISWAVVGQPALRMVTVKSSVRFSTASEFS